MNKKLPIIIIATILAVIIAIMSIVALSGNGEKSFIGTWNIVAVTDTGIEYTATEYIGYTEFSVIISEDGTFVINDYGYYETGTWEVVGETLYMYSEYDYTIQGQYERNTNQLLLGDASTFNEYHLHFVKQ